MIVKSARVGDAHSLRIALQLHGRLAVELVVPEFPLGQHGLLHVIRRADRSAARETPEGGAHVGQRIGGKRHREKKSENEMSQRSLRDGNHTTV